MQKLTLRANSEGRVQSRLHDLAGDPMPREGRIQVSESGYCFSTARPLEFDYAQEDRKPHLHRLFANLSPSSHGDRSKQTAPTLYVVVPDLLSSIGGLASRTRNLISRF